MIQSQIFGKVHLSVANSLHNLGNCYRDIGDLDKSAECLSKSLSLLTLAFGEENVDVADTSHCFAVTLMARSDFDDAISLFERALAIRKKRLGSHNLSTASTLYNLAVAFQLTGGWTNAMKYCKEALKIQRLTLGDNNPIVSSTLECIGRIHKDKRDFEYAIQCFTTCIEQGTTRLVREIGLIHLFRGEEDKAREYFSKAAAYATKALEVSDANNSLTSKLQTKKHQTKDEGLVSLIVLRYFVN